MADRPSLPSSGMPDRAGLPARREEQAAAPARRQAHCPVCLVGWAPDRPELRCWMCGRPGRPGSLRAAELAARLQIRLRR